MKIRRLQLKNNEYSLLFQIALIIFTITVCSYGLNQLGIMDQYRDFANVILIGSISILLFVQFSQFLISTLERGIILAGYIIRILVAWIDIYAADYITVLHSGDDSIAFWNVSLEIKRTGDAFRASAYSRLLSKFFGCYGENRFLAQYVNILCFLGVAIIVIAICKEVQIKKKYQVWILAFISFLPNYICLSSILLRESFMIFADTLAFLCFIQWMKKGAFSNFILAFLCVLPAVIMHSVSVGMWVAFFIIGMLWDYRKQKMKVSLKTAIMLIAAAGVLTVFEAVPALRDILLLYFPSELSVQSITGKYFVPGGSDYLTGIEVTTWGGLLFWTPIRMLYFLLSPMPTDWRGIGDMAAFAIDSVPIIVFVAGILKGLKKNRNKSYVYAGLLCCLIITGIFAWGVTNAGTAMRHRALLIGVFAVTYCISKGEKAISEGDKCDS